MLSIVIVNYKNPALLRLCLKSLTRTLASDFPHEIIVVDIATTIETEYAATEDFVGIQYLPFSENIGYTRGVNAGIAAARGDAVLIINSDIIPLTGSIEHLYQRLTSDRTIGLIGPRLLNVDGSSQQSYFRFYTPLTILCRRTFLGRTPLGKKILQSFFMTDRDLARGGAVDWLSGSALMVSKKAIATVGPMDENLFLYMSDVDWPRRFWENGYRVVWEPSAGMYHYHHRQSHERSAIGDTLFNREARLHITDGIRYFLKHGLTVPHYYDSQ